jgi:hypothetical protein
MHICEQMQGREGEGAGFPRNHGSPGRRCKVAVFTQNSRGLRIHGLALGDRGRKAPRRNLASARRGCTNPEAQKQTCAASLHLRCELHLRAALHLRLRRATAPSDSSAYSMAPPASGYACARSIITPDMRTAIEMRVRRIDPQSPAQIDFVAVTHAP